MYITHLHLQQFRNHVDSPFAFAPHINVLTGLNGAGKTNVIDAIHYLCMSRSFVASSDQYVAHSDAGWFSISGEFKGEIRSAFTVRCTYSRGEGKKFFVNDSPLERLSDLIGMVPVVVLSPDDKKLTRDGPNERRTFVDMLISQISSSYLKDLMEYKRIIKQRNKLLSDAMLLGDAVHTLLEPWDEQFIQTGARIIQKRVEVLTEFKNYLAKAYEMIAQVKHRPDFLYKTIKTSFDQVDIGEIRQQLAMVLKQQLETDLNMQYTTAGPHRDDLLFTLDEVELRRYGSQGQHRLFALSLKLAQLFFFSEHLDDLPIFLLDDVFGDLDPTKVEVLLQMLMDHKGQTFITTANPSPFDRMIPFNEDANALFTIVLGKPVQS